MSRSTLPAPTLGSWSLSPTMISRVPGTSARSTLRIRKISTIDISSMISVSISSGLSCPRAKSPSSPPYSSSRCSVLASMPQASLMRLAARPVGAASAISPLTLSRRMMHLMIVVLPVPGPPVITVMPLLTAVSIARRCWGWKVTPSRRSSSSICADRSVAIVPGMASIISRSLRATSTSAWYVCGRYTATMSSPSPGSICAISRRDRIRLSIVCSISSGSLPSSRCAHRESSSRGK